MLKGSIVRAPLFASDLLRERIYFDDEVRDLLWPSFFAGQGELLDRNPVAIELPSGSHTSLSLDHFGQGNWGTLGTPDFWNWLQTCRATTGDALIIEAVDAEARGIASASTPKPAETPPHCAKEPRRSNKLPRTICGATGLTAWRSGQSPGIFSPPVITGTLSRPRRSR